MDSFPADVTARRQLAEGLVCEKNPGPPEGHGALPPDVMSRMLYDLQVHEIELETQNGQLRRTQRELEAMLARYVDLYELAPVGYCTLNPDDLIREINLTACRLFGANRDTLINAPISHYIAPESQDAFHSHRQSLQANGLPQFRELRMVRGDGTAFWVKMTCSVTVDGGGNRSCRMVLSDITDQVRAREALENSEMKYRALYQSMMDGYAEVDMDGRLLDWNRVFQEMLGYTDDELRKLSYRDLTPQKWHDMESLLVDEQIIPRGFTDLYKKEYVRADGTVFPVELRAKMVRDSGGNPQTMWAIIRDITERKQDERTLREWNRSLERRVAERAEALYDSEARFRLLVEASFEGIAISKDGMILDGNPRFAAIHRCELAGMIGRPVSDFIAPESREFAARRLAAGDEASYEFMGLRVDGTRVPLEAHSRVMTWQGVEKRVTTFRDLTAAKEAEAIMVAQKAELDQAVRLAMISEISAGIIHQIGQPLCAIGANLAAAITTLNACIMNRCGGLEILHDIELDLSRIKDSITHLRALANPEKSNLVPIDFNAMVSKALDVVRGEARKFHFGLELELDAALPRFRADPVQLIQVVVNLLRNAFDASGACPPERRVIGITTRGIPGVGIELCVRDRGCGIAPAAMDRLFSTFFTTKAEGFGVGLRLSRTIVEAHGGSIEGFNNADGVGATFRVMLPASDG